MMNDRYSDPDLFSISLTVPITSHVYYESNNNDIYSLLLARLRAIEQELATLREEVAELREQVSEAWLGGTD